MSVLPGRKPSLEPVQGVGSNRERFTAFLTDEVSEKLVRQCVGEMSLSFSSVHRGDVSKAIQHLSTARSPLALMIDVSGSDMAASDVNRLAEVCEPGVSVVVIGDRNDVGLYRDLVRAGVSDYLVKPLTRGLVQAALDTMLGVNAPTSATPLSQKTGTVVSVIGTRGGVGASTVAVNLAWHLANKESRRVALIDLDVHFGDCALLLDLKIVGGLRDALESPARVDDLFLERTMVRCGDRLFVLACEDKLEAPIRVDPEALPPLLASLRKQFHYVVLDTPRFAGPLLRQATELSNARVIVADQTTHSIRDAIRLKPFYDPPQQGQRNIVVLNRMGEAGKTGIGTKEMSEAIGLPVHVSIPFQAKGVIGAANAGIPVTGSRGTFSQAIATIAHELAGRGLEPRKRVWSFLK